MVISKQRMTVFLMFQVFESVVEKAESLEEIREWTQKKLEENKKSVVNDFKQSLN